MKGETLICIYHGMRQLRHWALQVESRGDAIKGVKDKQASIEGKTDGNGDINQNGGMDGTTTSVSIDSMQVDEALLAVGSQYMHQT